MLYFLFLLFFLSRNPIEQMAPKRRQTSDASSSSTGTSNDPPVIKAVIIMGGPSRGTRFRPLSFNVPKPLFPVAGDPLLSHHIDACTKVGGFRIMTFPLF